MKIERSSRVWINCRTRKEQQEVLEIFESIGAHWPMGSDLTKHAPYTPPMHFLLENCVVRHGMTPICGGSIKNGMVVIEARDLHNQCISVRRKR